MKSLSFISTISLALSLLSTSPFVRAFSFNTSTPTQCGQFTVHWDGGTEPFYLVLVPANTVTSGQIVNVSIPTGLQKPYSHTFTLNEPAGLEFLATMYDSTGFGTGGTTGVLTVGSADDTSCLNRNLLYDFTFSIDPQSDPAQCSTQHIEWNNNVTDPVNLYGLIPSGTAFSLPISQSQAADTYDWTVNIASGTQYLLFMSDAGQFQTGGSTPLLKVAQGDTGCMNSTSPSAGSGSSQGSPTGSGSSPSSSVSGVGGSSSGGDSSGSGTGGSGGSKTNTGAIVGGTVGGVAFLVLLGLLLFFCIQRRARTRRDSSGDPAIKSYGVASGSNVEKRRNNGPLDLLAGRKHNSGDTEMNLSPGGRTRAEDYEPSPFRYPSPPESPGGAFGHTPSASIGQQQHGGGVLAAAGIAKAQQAREESQNQDTPGTPTLPSSNIPDLQTTPSRTETGSSPMTRDATHDSGVHPPTAWTDQSTDGPTSSGNGDMGRHSSIRKTPSSGQVAGTGAGGIGGGGVAGAGVNGVPSSPGGRPLPDVPDQTPMQFVQHEDSGRIVDLPPRYDQLRTANPDPE